MRATLFQRFSGSIRKSPNKIHVKTHNKSEKQPALQCFCGASCGGPSALLCYSATIDKYPVHCELFRPYISQLGRSYWLLQQPKWEISAALPKVTAYGCSCRFGGCSFFFFLPLSLVKYRTKTVIPYTHSATSSVPHYLFFRYPSIIQQRSETFRHSPSIYFTFRCGSRFNN